MAPFIVIVTLLVMIMVWVFFVSIQSRSILKREFSVHWRNGNSVKDSVSKYTLSLEMFRSGLSSVPDEKFHLILSELLSEKNFHDFDNIKVFDSNHNPVNSYPSFSICQNGEVSLMLSSKEVKTVEFFKSVKGVSLKIVFTENALNFILQQGDLRISQVVVQHGN
jgi:hypothetical protein